MKPPQNMLAHAIDAPAFMQEKTYLSVITETLKEAAKWANGPEKSRSLTEKMLGPVNPTVTMKVLSSTHKDRGAIADDKA